MKIVCKQVVLIVDIATEHTNRKTLIYYLKKQKQTVILKSEKYKTMLQNQTFEVL